MLYNNYEEYMRNVLGHSYTPGNTYEQFDNNYYSYDKFDHNNCHNCNPYNNCPNCMNYNFTNRNTQYTNSYNTPSNIEQMYPDLYKLINPMVCDMCDKNNQPITEDLVEQMINNIYDNVVNRVEIQNVINLNIETRDMSTFKETRDTEAGTSKNDCVSCSRINNANNRSLNNSSVINSKTKENEKSTENRSPLQSSRPRRNRLLQDLIRILILNELSRRNRPPFRPGPGPMPMPPRPWF